MVTQEQAGRNVIYRAACDRMDGVIGYLAENCCKGLPEKAAKTVGGETPRSHAIGVASVHPSTTPETQQAHDHPRSRP